MTEEQEKLIRADVAWLPHIPGRIVPREDAALLLAEIDRLRVENLHYLENVAVLVKERDRLKAALAEAQDKLDRLLRRPR